jgi:hypothetical protein
MSNLAQVNDLGLRRALGDRCYSYATLAINAGGAATIKTTGATSYSVDGIMYTKAALSAQAITVTHNLLGNAVAGGVGPAAYVQPASTTVIYLVALNAAGTVAIVQGGYNGLAITTPSGIVRTSRGEAPEVPLGYTPIGYMKVALGATTFTPGTTLLDAANVTVTYGNLSVLPASATL